MRRGGERISRRPCCRGGKLRLSAFRKGGSNRSAISSTNLSVSFPISMLLFIDSSRMVSSASISGSSLATLFVDTDVIASPLLCSFDETGVVVGGAAAAATVAVVVTVGVAIVVVVSVV